MWWRSKRVKRNRELVSEIESQFFKKMISRDHKIFKKKCPNVRWDSLGGWNKIFHRNKSWNCTHNDIEQKEKSLNLGVICNLWDILFFFNLVSLLGKPWARVWRFLPYDYHYSFVEKNHGWIFKFLESCAVSLKGKIVVAARFSLQFILNLTWNHVELHKNI